MSVKADVSGLLMPKATAVWMIENTMLTFGQIAEFTGLHEIEVQALADEDVGRGIVGRDPVAHGEITAEELARGQTDPNAKLQMAKSELPPLRKRSKGPRYTPVSKRGDKPNAIAWILKHHPEITDAQIVKLVGTTKPTIANVRDRTHPDTPNIKPQHPADLGLCTYAELDEASRKSLKAQGKDPDAIRAEQEAAAAAQREAEQEGSDPADSAASGTFGGFDFSNFLKKSGE